MNILFFLTPKSDVAYLFDDFTVRQAIEKIKYHGYSAIPMIDREGRYIGTVTEGDLLWYILDKEGINWENDTTRIGEIKRRVTHHAVNADMCVESLINLVMNQNFVPVVDDRQRFIGIVTRKAIVQHCAQSVVQDSKSECKKNF